MWALNGDGSTDLALQVETENADPGTFEHRFGVLRGGTFLTASGSRSVATVEILAPHDKRKQ